jgi:hypothetical protein
MPHEFFDMICAVLRTWALHSITIRTVVTTLIPFNSGSEFGVEAGVSGACGIAAATLIACFFNVCRTSFSKFCSLVWIDSFAFCFVLFQCFKHSDRITHPSPLRHLLRVVYDTMCR